MDMSAIYEDMGLDYGALMEMTTGDVDYTALLSLLLSTVEPNDKDTAYSELTQAVDLAAQLCGTTPGRSAGTTASFTTPWSRTAWRRLHLHPHHAG